MNRNFWIIAGLGLLFAWVLGWSAIGVLLWFRDAALPASVAKVEDFRFRFGEVANDGSNHYTISEETTTIPMKFGDSTYGFEVIPPDDEAYSLQFIAHFPYAPKTVSGDVYASNIPSATMPSQIFQMQGECVEDLGFDPGDPVGDQSIDILINGRTIKTIKFTVTPPASDYK